MRPADPTYAGESLWVTIDCVDTAAASPSSSEDDSETLRLWLGDRPYRVADDGQVGDTDLAVNAPDFTKAEFRSWVEVWLRAKGFPVTDLVDAPLSEFAGTHRHADFLIQLTSGPSDR